MLTQIGKYDLIRKIATGGMAEVYLAKAAGPMGFEKTLVVKRILPHLAEDQNFVEMFLGEAKLAAQLNHPNVVQIFDFGEAEGAHFIAMEYIDGPNLRGLSKRARALGRPIPFALCAKTISFAAEGLAYAHDFADPATGAPLGLIHRDISPDNILIGRNGGVKVVDFGIAKTASQAHHTRTGTLKGKLAYMPPEQLQQKPLDRRVDVFALGMVLYELLAGAKPFDATSEVTIMQAILYEPLVPITSRRPDVPAALQAILDRALAKDRDQRYASCRELQIDLERFILSTGEPVGAFQLAALVGELAAPPAPNTGPKSAPTVVPSPPVKSEATTQMVARGHEAVEIDLATAVQPTVPAKTKLATNPEEIAPTPRRSRAPVFVAAVAVVLVAAGAYVALGRDTAPVPQPLPTDAVTVKDITPPVGSPKPAEPPAPVAKAEPEPAPPAPPIEKTDPAPEPVTAPAVAHVAKKRSAKEVVAARVEQKKAAPTPVAETIKLAHFRVETSPPAQVKVNGKFIGLSPVIASGIEPGDVEVEIYDSRLGFRKKQRFTVAAGDNGTKKVAVASGTVEFRVRPWATVMLDDHPLGQTPFPAVKAYEGRHQVRLINRELKKEVTVHFEVKPGDNIFKYNLSE